MLKKLFFHKLKGISSPERKRKIIGETFIRVFEQQSRKIKNVDFLAQGTIYPDVIESSFQKILNQILLNLIIMWVAYLKT